MVEKIDLEARVIEGIRTCYDPEIPVNIYELGMIYNINIDDNSNVHVSMTLTSPNCPVAESLPVDVERKVQDVEGVNKASVEIVWEPPWNMGMMTEAAKLELGML